MLRCEEMDEIHGQMADDEMSNQSNEPEDVRGKKGQRDKGGALKKMMERE